MLHDIAEIKKCNLVVSSAGQLLHWISLKAMSAGLLEISSNGLSCQLVFGAGRGVQITLRSITIMTNSLFSRQFMSGLAHVKRNDSLR